MKFAKTLRIASILIIALAIIDVALCIGLLNAPEYFTFIVKNGEEALQSVVASYAIDAIEILAGIAGLVLAGKKSTITLVCGAILFATNLYSAYFNTTPTFTGYIVLIIMFVPCLLYYGAAWATYEEK